MAEPGSPVSFVVESVGATATKWLCACLNAHPEILCAHSFFWPPSLPRFEVPGPSDEELWQRPYLRDAVEYFSRLHRSTPGKRCYGTVHGFQVDAAESLKFLGAARPAFLVRHPVMQVESILRHWLDRCQVDPAFRELRLGQEESCWTVIGPIGAKVASQGFDRRGATEPERLLFVCLVSVLIGFERARRNPAARTFSMEGMVSNAEYLGGMLDFLAGGTIAGLDGFAADILSRPAINRHRGERKTVADTFAAWPSWARVLFREMAGLGFGDFFLSLGYGLEFLTDRP